MTEGNNQFNQTGDLPADAVKLLELAGQWLEANPRDVQAKAKARDMVARLAEIATTPPAPPLETVTWAQVGIPTPLSWIVQDWMPRGYLVLLTGQARRRPGSGSATMPWRVASRSWRGTKRARRG